MVCDCFDFPVPMLAFVMRIERIDSSEKSRRTRIESLIRRFLQYSKVVRYKRSLTFIFATYQSEKSFVVIGMN